MPACCPWDLSLIVVVSKFFSSLCFFFHFDIIFYEGYDLVEHILDAIHIDVDMSFVLNKIVFGF